MKLRDGIAQIRCQETATGCRNLSGHHRQQPDSSHLVDAVILTGKHQVGDQHATAQRHGHIDPPQHFGHLHHAVTPARYAEHQKTVDDGGQAHGDGAKEHRHCGVPENALRLVEIQHPARAIKHAE